MKKNNKKGFTLVELVIVVAVMAVLVAVAIPTVKSVVGTAKTSVYGSNCRTIESTIKLEEAEQANLGVNTLTGAMIQTALNEAKLGIAPTGTSGDVTHIFYYHPSNGSVTGSNTAISGETVYTITYDTDGTATVDPAT